MEVPPFHKMFYKQLQWVHLFTIISITPMQQERLDTRHKDKVAVGLRSVVHQLQGKAAAFSNPTRLLYLHMCATPLPPFLLCSLAGNRRGVGSAKSAKSMASTDHQRAPGEAHSVRQFSSD